MMGGDKMQLLRVQIEQIRSICYNWYMLMFSREIVTSEGIRFL